MAFMLHTWLIYVIVFISAFVTYGMALLNSQYIFMKVAQSYNTTGQGQTSCYGNISTEVDVLVARDSSRYTLMLTICVYVPGCIVGFLIISWSDKVGRKTAITIPAVGIVLASLSFTLTVFFDWPLETLYISSIINGLTGTYSTISLQGNAFLSDIVDNKRRGQLFVILDCCVGIGGGIAGFVGGIWLKAEGYVPPLTACVIFSALLLIFIFFLPDSTKIKQENNKTKEEDAESLLRGESTELILEQERNGNDLQIKEDSLLITKDLDSRLYGSCDSPTTSEEIIPSKKSPFFELVKTVWHVYSSEYSHCEKCHDTKDGNAKPFVDRCCHGGGFYPGRIWRLWVYLISGNLILFVLVGTGQFQMTFNLSYPLCFTPELMGAQMGLKFCLLAMAPFVVMVFQRLLSMSNNTIIITGFVGFFISSVTMAFATTPATTFIATAVLLIVFPSHSFMKAQISNLVSQHEQGAVFALVSFGDAIALLISSVTFLTLYPATVEIFNGFAWLFSALVVVFPIFAITVVAVKDRERQRLEIGVRDSIIT